MFPCEYSKIFKNTYFEEHPPTAAYVQSNIVSDKSKTNNAFKQRNLKRQNAQMEEFSIRFIKTLKSKIIYLKSLETISYFKLRHQAIT